MLIAIFAQPGISWGDEIQCQPIDYYNNADDNCLADKGAAERELAFAKWMVDGVWEAMEFTKIKKILEDGGPDSHNYETSRQVVEKLYTLRQEIEKIKSTCRKEGETRYNDCIYRESYALARKVIKAKFSGMYALGLPRRGCAHLEDDVNAHDVRMKPKFDYAQDISLIADWVVALSPNDPPRILSICDASHDADLVVVHADTHRWGKQTYLLPYGQDLPPPTPFQTDAPKVDSHWVIYDLADRPHIVYRRHFTYQADNPIGVAISEGVWLVREFNGISSPKEIFGGAGYRDDDMHCTSTDGTPRVSYSFLSRRPNGSFHAGDGWEKTDVNGDGHLDLKLNISEVTCETREQTSREVIFLATEQGFTQQ